MDSCQPGGNQVRTGSFFLIVVRFTFPSKLGKCWPFLKGLHAVFEDGAADSLGGAARPQSAVSPAPAAPAATAKTGKKYEVVGGADKVHLVGWVSGGVDVLAVLSLHQCFFFLRVSPH